MAELRREAGQWLKRLREAKGVSQRDLAETVGIEYYTFISQVESGRGRIPPDRFRDWAKALGVPAREFVTKLMRYYDPVRIGFFSTEMLSSAMTLGALWSFFSIR